jgi:hypothetical protein
MPVGIVSSSQGKSLQKCRRARKQLSLQTLSALSRKKQNPEYASGCVSVAPNAAVHGPFVEAQRSKK